MPLIVVFEAAFLLAFQEYWIETEQEWSCRSDCTLNHPQEMLENRDRIHGMSEKELMYLTNANQIIELTSIGIGIRKTVCGMRF